jgi:tetratricopeptide (TPR) repeat protein
MSMDNKKQATDKSKPTEAAPTPTSSPATIPAKTPPLFRRIDWLTCLVTTLAVWAGYFWTLAPDLGLEDSGELAVASLYGGVPHPPGYPIWTIYTYFWANFLPFGNIAWRIAVGEAVAGGLACGLLGLLVSRGSSMLMEGIEDLKKISGKWENAICMVSGFVGGLLLGYNGYMWSQSIIVEVYSFSVLSLIGVLLFLLRWVYAPHQLRYLYLAFFMYGICVNNHQSLLPIAMGLEVLALMVNPRMGKEFLFWNTFIYLLALSMNISLLAGNIPVFVIFNFVGLGSAAGWVWLMLREKKPTEAWLGGGAVAIAALLFIANKIQIGTPKTPAEVLKATELLSSMKTTALLGLLAFTGVRLYAAYDSLFVNKLRRSREWFATIGSGLAFAVGMSFYLYMPLAGMSNPPMQWGYPRTIEGFIHAFTRGQYEKISPTKGVGDNLFEQIANFVGTYTKQLLMYLDGLDNEFNLVCILIAVGVFLFYRQMQKRERNWLIGVAAIFLCLGPMLVLLLNPPPDRQARELVRVFFTASHVAVSIGVGYGIALMSAYLATHYQTFRKFAILIAIVAVDFALYALAVETYSHLGDPTVAGLDRFQNGFVKVTFMLLGAISLLLATLQLMRISETSKASFKPVIALAGIGLGCLLVVVVMFNAVQLTPDQSKLGMFAKLAVLIPANAEIGTDGPAMIGFAKLICVLIASVSLFLSSRNASSSDGNVLRRIAVLILGFSFVMTITIMMGEKYGIGGIANFFTTLFELFEPGQFGMPVWAKLVLLGLTVVFLISLLLWRNRAPLALTLALFATMPLESYMAHWADNEQRGHLFGYWFGHDMFSPPFKNKDGKPIYPEMTRDAILYGGTDPGRFCPTYTIFCESFIPPECKPLDPEFDRRDVYIITQNALADGTYLNYIRAHYHRSAQKIRGLDTPFFEGAVLKIGENFGKESENPNAPRQKNKLEGLAKSMKPLDEFFTGVGESIEKNRRAGSSYFTEADFLDVSAFAAKLREGGNGLAKQIAGKLSADARNLLAGGDQAALKRALAKDLNKIIEEGLYDDRAMATNWAARWQTTFELEAIYDEKQRVQQLGPIAMQRLAAQENIVKQRFDRIQNELEKQSKAVQDELSAKGVAITPNLAAFILETPQSFTRIRLQRQIIEAAFPKDIAISKGGVYPDREMYIASPQDSQVCFQEYLQDAQRRLQLNQLRPGEDVKIVDNRVQVSGQVAVMAINGLLTKVMFDKNPNNEFFVEESFPLDWMYPHLTPFGIIMKINRKPLTSFTEDVFERDHQFWSQYSDRLIGNWITYDTPVSNIVDFVERVYLRHNWSGLNEGQKKFARDDNGQKAFSKLRSSIGGVYAWRLSPQCPPEYAPKTDAERRRLYKEADFTFRQAFAFCPYSPEALFRYVQLLIQPPPGIAPRFDDALLIARTAQKLDPYNGQIAGLIGNLEDYKKRLGQFGNAEKLEEAVRKNPNDLNASFSLGLYQMQVQQFDKGYETLDRVVANPKVELQMLASIMDIYKQLGNFDKVEKALVRLTQLQPDSPEAWYDLSTIRVSLGRTVDAFQAISNAITISDSRKKKTPDAKDLTASAKSDPYLASLRALPEFQKLVGQ